MSLDLLPDEITYALTLAVIVLPPLIIGYVAFAVEKERQ